MRSIVPLPALLVFSLVAACGGGGLGSPSEADARLTSRVDDGRRDRLQLASFSKTYGVAGETNGVKTYTINFTAEAQAQEEAYVMVQETIMPTLVGLWALELPRSDRFIPMMRPPEFDYARKLPSRGGMQLVGSMSFEKHESG